MYELVQVAPHTYYIQSPAKIGLVVLDETSICLIDSGNDKSAGRKIRQILDLGLTAPLRSIRCLSPVFSTAAVRRRISGTNFSWRRKVRHSR